MKKLMLVLMALVILVTPTTSAGAITTSRSFSSPSRSYSAPRTYSAPRVTTPAPKPVVTPKPAPKPVTQAPAPTTTKPAPASPKKVAEKPKYKGELKESNRYRNAAGQTVVYQERGISPWMFWLGFGFLWYNQDNDKCYDDKHNLIECKEKA